MTPPATLPFADRRNPGRGVRGSLGNAHAEIRLLRLLSSFFGNCPHPTEADWLRLIDDYPDQEVGIIDFAVHYAASGRVSHSHLPIAWRASGASDGATTSRAVG